MRIVYILLSPTFGMHQYTADLANRMADGPGGHEVHLVTVQTFPRDRYAPGVHLHPVAHAGNSGLALQSLRLDRLRAVGRAILALAPEVVHFTGPHLWNVPLVRALRRAGVPVIHSLHDLDPHAGTRLGPLLHVWNRLIMHSAARILVHGEQYRARLAGLGFAERVAYTPLLHLFLSHANQAAAHAPNGSTPDAPDGERPLALFFGRLEKYKGVDNLLAAYAMLGERAPAYRPPAFDLALAGPGELSHFWTGGLPRGVTLHNGLVEDALALDLFRRCSLVVLPYVDATQSALIAAAYFFHKPVLVTHVGALPEYVVAGETGFVVEPNHPPSLARALNEAFSDPARLRAMGAAGRAWYERRRAEELHGLLALYRECGGESKNEVLGVSPAACNDYPGRIT